MLTVFADRAGERFRLLFTSRFCKLKSAAGVFTALVAGVSWPTGSPIVEDAEDVREDVREEACSLKSGIPTTLGSIFWVATARKSLWRGKPTT